MVDAVWSEYRRTGSVDARNRLAEHYWPVVQAIAWRLRKKLPGHSFLDSDDLAGCGAAGLLKAIEGYDPDKCDAFLPYARMRVRGAMIDALRTQDMIPRNVRNDISKLDDVEHEFEAEHERAPSDRELADLLNWTPRRLRRVRSCVRDVVPLEGTLESIGFERSDSWQVIVMDLTPLQMAIVTHVYYQGRTLRDTADRLDMSMHKVSEARRELLSELEKRLRGRQKLI